MRWIRESVAPAIAETPTIIGFQASVSARMTWETRVIRLASTVREPPNFMTSVAIGRLEFTSPPGQRFASDRFHFSEPGLLLPGAITLPRLFPRSTAPVHLPESARWCADGWRKDSASLPAPPGDSRSRFAGL